MISFRALGNLGRLGNQLFQYAFLRSAARRLSTRFYCPPWIGDRVFHLDDQDERAPAPGPIARSYRQPPLNVGFDQRVLDAVQDGDDVSGYFQSARYFHDDAEVRRWYRFKTEAVPAAKYAAVDFDDSVGLHLRFGDKKDDPRFYLPCREFYLRALSQSIPRRKHVIVFSDEPDAARAYLPELGASALFMEGNEPYEDLYLMSRRRDLISSASTLSWWGAWLNPREDKIVVAPAEGHLRPGAPIKNTGYWCDGWIQAPGLRWGWDRYLAVKVRNRLKRLLFAALACLLAAAPAAAKELGRLSSSDGLVLVFRASPVGNLTYNLNCLAGIGSCASEVYRGFWQDQGWTEDDEKAVARWRELLTKYESPAEDPPGPAAAVPINTGSGAKLAGLRIAGFKSETWDEYAANLSPPMTPVDAREALALAQAFRPRFDAWWAREGRANAEAAGLALKELAVRKDLVAFFAKAARFYGYAHAPGAMVEFDFMAQPRSKTRRTNGEQVGSHSAIETVLSERPEDRIDVVAHELFHYFYYSAPRAVRERLLANLARSPEPFAYAAYGLLNESVATALGQGLVSRMVLPADEFAEILAGKDRLYSDSVINDAAKALVAPLEDCLRRGTAIDDPAFAAAFLKAVREGLGPRASSPRAWFRNTGFAYHPDLKAAKDRFSSLMRHNSAWSYTLDEPGAAAFFEEHPGLSGALFLKPRDLDALGPWAHVLGVGAAAEAAALAKDEKPFVYGVKRSEKAYLYLFVGPDAASVAALVDRFAEGPGMFSGPLKSPVTLSPPAKTATLEKP